MSVGAKRRRSSTEEEMSSLLEEFKALRTDADKQQMPSWLDVEKPLDLSTGPKRRRMDDDRDAPMKLTARPSTRLLVSNLASICSFLSG